MYQRSIGTLTDRLGYYAERKAVGIGEGDVLGLEELVSGILSWTGLLRTLGGSIMLEGRLTEAAVKIGYRRYWID